jgi:hypothetical protein
MSESSEALLKTAAAYEGQKTGNRRLKDVVLDVPKCFRKSKDDDPLHIYNISRV